MSAVHMPSHYVIVARPARVQTKCMALDAVAEPAVAEPAVAEPAVAEPARVQTKWLDAAAEASAASATDTSLDRFRNLRG